MNQEPKVKSSAMSAAETAGASVESIAKAFPTAKSAVMDSVASNKLNKKTVALQDYEKVPQMKATAEDVQVAAGTVMDIYKKNISLVSQKVENDVSVLSKVSGIVANSSDSVAKELLKIVESAASEIADGKASPTVEEVSQMLIDKIGDAVSSYATVARKDAEKPCQEKVCNIIGMGASGRIAPFGQGERWGINCSFKYGAMDKLFFMDDIHEWIIDEPHIEPKDYTFNQFLRDNPNCELISRFPQTVVDDKKNALAKISPFPLNEAVKLAPGGYFTSTVAYCICYAIIHRYDRIRLYGFEIWSGSDANEYVHQRPCIEFWVAYAMGRGIKVEVPYYLMHANANQQNFYGYHKGELYQNQRR